MKQIIIIIISSFLLIACNGKAQTNQNATNKFKDIPKAKALLKKFKKQEHRLEINDCEIVYNGKSFFLGSTLEEIETLFSEKYDFNYGFAFAWKNINIKVRTEKKSNIIDIIYIYISEGYKNVIQPNLNIILVNGAPLTKDMLFNDFLDTSNYSFDDFYIDNHSFYLNPENCKLKNVKINFDSQPFYHYSGTGHMRIRGDFDDSKTNPINTISIFQTED